MTRFRFNHLSYEVPADVDVYVRRVETNLPSRNEFYDFDFVKDGVIVSVLGGELEDGSPALSWADVGIRQIETLKITDPIEG